MERMNFLQKFLYKIDFFKEPFYLLFQKKRVVSTNVGSFFSLVIIIVLLYFFITSNMVNRINPFVIDEIKTSVSSPPIKLTPENFEIAMGVADYMGNGFHDPTIFNMKIAQVQVTFNASSKSKYINKQELKNTRPCSHDTFSDPETFDDLSLANFTCLQNASFELEGGLDEKAAKLIVIYIDYCNNKTDNVTCKNQSQITQFFNGKGLWFYYKDYHYDTHQEGDPIKKSWRLTTVKTAGVTRNSNLIIKKLEFLNDNNFLLAPDTQNFVSWIKEAYEFSGNQMINNPLVSINIFSSKNQQSGYRKYQTLGQLMAMIGGLISLLKIFGTFITEFFIRLKMQIVITNKLFAFYKKENKSEESSPRISEPSSPGKRNDLSESQRKKSGRIQQKKKTNIGFDMLKYFKMLMKMFFHQKLNSEELSYILSESKSEKITDIVNVLQKIKEFEKLKMIVLTEEQQKIFGLLANRVISIENDEKENERENEEMPNDPEIQTLYEKLINKPELSSFDINMKKLIEKKFLIKTKQ